jgi:hypothetical protein
LTQVGALKVDGRTEGDRGRDVRRLRPNDLTGLGCDNPGSASSERRFVNARYTGRVAALVGEVVVVVVEGVATGFLRLRLRVGVATITRRATAAG